MNLKYAQVRVKQIIDRKNIKENSLFANLKKYTYKLQIFIFKILYLKVYV